MPKNEENILSQIYNTEYEYAFHSDKKHDVNWKPWHKPRKQWIRDNQWLKEIRKLKALLRLEDRPLSYFSLPGDDLLDFRLVASLCDTDNIKVKLVGFNDVSFCPTSSSAHYLARNQVFSQKNVVASSDIHTDDFKKISDTASVAHQIALKKGPYDIINLDLCDSFSGENKNESYYNSTFKLLNFQANHRAEPWIFLLTTRGDAKKVNIDDFNSFWSSINQNISMSSKFKESFFKDFINANETEISNFADFMKQQKSPSFEKTFGLSLCKWLLGIFHTTRRWKMQLLDSYWYRTNSARKSFPNMLSLAFVFFPISSPLTDPTGLVGDSSQDFFCNEEEQAFKIIDSMNRIQDIDSIIEKNQSELEKSIKNSEELLIDAGYETSSYAAWCYRDGTNHIP